MTETTISHTARDADGAASAADGAPSVADVCRQAAALVRDTHGPLRRLTVRSGPTVVELEWAGAPGEVAAPVPEPSAGQTVQAAGAAAAHAGTAPGTGAASAAADGVRHVAAVMVGTFYHAPEPGAAPFVSPGDLVDKGQQIGILEAMKLMNPIESDVRGRVVEVLVPDGTSVEYGQPLIAVAPERSEEL
ncbi:acetyl-CoA carboxylase biotin carboxyl carrier protein [Nocardiopsis sp. NPDC050513]|uniref:acetyl-CoA carboxylase biotin carboxyl carrier protein n=1 Tax=Nocardiopsis sp. NPDC050513 TaxID=3364338 RepID=UPI0037A0A985